MTRRGRSWFLGRPIRENENSDRPFAALRARLVSLAKLAELLVFPSSCLLCSRPLDAPGERIVCRGCLDRLTVRRGSCCLCCGRFFEGVGEPHLCIRCLEKPPAFTRHRSCGRYDGELRDLILAFKYKRMPVLAKVLGRFAVDALGGDEDLWQGLDMIVPVPLHARRKRERGFNQSRLLARELGRAEGVEVEAKLLRKMKNVPPQAGLEGRERREENVRGVYGMRNPRRVRGKTVLLVDDVFTTGATIRECSRVLKEAGAAEVRALTIAQA